MTNEEALKIISSDFSGIVLKDGESHADIFQEAFKIVQDALEKRIPKEVVSEGMDESDWIYCPCCNEMLGTNDSAFISFFDNNCEPIYCHKCGQALLL